MRLLLLLALGFPPWLAADAGRDARWREDLATIATRLPALHPNLFFQTPRAVFDQAVADLNAAIPDLTDTQVMTGLAHIVALPGDGHTNLSLTQRNATFRILPLNLRWFEDGLFVTAAGLDYARAAGARVVRIGDRSAEEALQAISAIVSHENEIWVREFSPNYLVNADVLQALGIAPDALSVRFELLDRSGAPFQLDIASLDPGQSTKGVFAPDPNTGFIPFWRQRTAENYWFTYTESSRTLYFAYNACADQAGLPFAPFNAQLWATFDSRPVEHFLLDLRNNAGGNSQVLAPFLAAAAARGERFAQAQPSVIIGRRTYSSAIINAIQLDQGQTRFYGEATGGSPNSYGEVAQLVLPNSQLIVSYSTKYFSFPGYPAGSLLPDVPVKFYSADYFARHDPFSAAALAGGVAGPVPEASPVTLVNAAHFRADQPVAPGSLASLFGEFGTFSAGDAVEVRINDAPAPVLALAPGQINLRIPAATGTGAARIAVLRDGKEIAAGTASIAAAAPGIFAIVAVSPSVFEIYATGQGAADPPPDTRVYAGAEQAEVLFSGAHALYPGLWQINARLPEGASLAGETPVFVVTGSAPSNAVVVKAAN